MCAYFANDKNLNLLNPESEKLFRELVENIKMGVFMADGSDNLFYVNHAFNELFNFHNRNHALGKNWCDIIVPCLEQRSALLAQLQQNGVVNDFEITLTNSLGIKHSIIVGIKYIRNSQDVIIGLHGVVINISERRHLQEQLMSEHHKLEQILSFYNNLSTINTIEELAQYIVSQTSQILDAKRCSLMLIDPGSKELYIKASCGIPEAIAREARVGIGEPIAGFIILRNNGELVEDISYHEIYRHHQRHPYEFRSFMSAPLIFNDNVIGVINASERRERFNNLDLKVLETIARQSAINIHQTVTLNNLEHLSQTDPMTGLLNFRSFNQKLDEEVARTSRYQFPISLMMIDVDNFKTFNDTHGHPNGDKLLKRLANIFRANLRSTEWICRYGGDEFSVILPNTDLKQTQFVGEKLRDLVNTEFKADGISLSIGVAQFRQGTNKETFIHDADQALYQSKKSGRNKVSCYHHA